MRGRWPDSRPVFWKPLRKNGARRRPLYEAQDPRISILANGAAGRPDTFMQTTQTSGSEPLADGAGHMFSRASWRCREQRATNRARLRRVAAPTSRGAGRPRPQPPAMCPAAANSSATTSHRRTQQVLPLHAGAPNKDDAGQRSSIRSARPTAFRLFRLGRQKRLDHRSQVVGYQVGNSYN